MQLPLYRINGTDRTVRVSDAFAARFGGMTRVEEDVTSTPATPVKPRAKTTKTNSSKDGK